jgi:Amt family ammonium transporter
VYTRSPRADVRAPLPRLAVDVICETGATAIERRSLTVAANELAITANALAITGLQGAANTNLLLFCSALVFFMQAGFAMLCAGSIRSKNVMNILIKNVLDACVGALAFFAVGYGLAYGRKTNKDTAGDYIGEGNFLLSNSATLTGEGWTHFLFNWAFAAAAATICSGAMAERTQFVAYLGYSALLTGFVYPVVVHWCWSSDGWISSFNSSKWSDVGFIDLAGSGVVHMVGGFAGLMGAIMLGPRTGRFGMNGQPVPMPGHNATLTVLGTFVLWVGWYGFNPGSVYALKDLASAEQVGRSAVMTTLAAATGGVATLFLHRAFNKVWDLVAVCNGILAGLVSITAGCHVMDTHWTIFTAFVSALILRGSAKLLLKLRIDDPLEAFPIHGACGVWGCLAVGLFAKKKFLGNENYGLVLGGGGDLIGVQITGVLAIAAWTSVTLGVFFFILRKLGLLRISGSEEMEGLDTSKHGGSAYNMEKGGMY